MNTATGEVEEIDEKTLANKLGAPSNVAEKKLINAINPIGEPVQIKAEDAFQASLQGYDIENDQDTEKRKRREEFANRPFEAGLAGLGRSLTLGLSDQLLTKTGLVEPETLKNLEEENPTASLVGELGGYALPSGLAVKGGKIAAKALASKTAGLVAEGALQGAGDLISEEALGNADINAESIIAHVGLGALMRPIAEPAINNAVTRGLVKNKLTSRLFGKTPITAVNKIGGVLDNILPKKGSTQLDLFIPRGQQVEGLLSTEFGGLFKKGLKGLSDVASKTDGFITKGIDAFFDAATPSVARTIPKLTEQALFTRPKKSETKEESVERLRDDINELNNNPERLVDLVSKNTAGLSSVAPNTASRFGGIARNGVTYLYNAMPKSRAPKLFANEKRKISDSEIASFARKYEIVINPLSVLEKMHNGTLMKADMDVLKNVYPNLYDKINNKMIEALGERKAKLSYKKRYQLQSVFGMPDMDSKTMSVLQGSFTTAEEAPKSGKGKSDISSLYQTKNERLLAR